MAITLRISFHRYGGEATQGASLFGHLGGAPSLTARQLSLSGRHFPTVTPSKCVLSYRALPQQAGHKEQRRHQRKAPLPGFNLNLRAGMAVDLPGEVINPA